MGPYDRKPLAVPVFGPVTAEWWAAPEHSSHFQEGPPRARFLVRERLSMLATVSRQSPKGPGGTPGALSLKNQQVAPRCPDQLGSQPWNRDSLSDVVPPPALRLLPATRVTVTAIVPPLIPRFGLLELDMLEPARVLALSSGQLPGLIRSIAAALWIGPSGTPFPA